MKRNANHYIWGIVFIIAGLLLGGKALNFIHFNLFFDGWWTLFIILPCFFGLFTGGKDKISNLIGLCIGILLLLASREVIRWNMFGPLCLAVILILVGVQFLLRREYKTESKSSENSQYAKEFDFSSEKATYQTGYCSCTAIFSGRDIKYNQKEFSGAALSCICGGIDLDLRDAIIRKNVVIDARAVLGGIDIFVPNNVKVELSQTPILGGVDDLTAQPLNYDENTPTIFINATCVLGGIDIK